MYWLVVCLFQSQTLY